MNKKTDGVYVASEEAQAVLVKWLLAHGVTQAESNAGWSPFGLEIRVNPHMPKNKAAIISGDAVQMITFGEDE